MLLNAIAVGAGKPVWGRCSAIHGPLNENILFSYTPDRLTSPHHTLQPQSFSLLGIKSKATSKDKKEPKQQYRAIVLLRMLYFLDVAVDVAVFF